jgi:hypothetical protein
LNDAERLRELERRLCKRPDAGLPDTYDRRIYSEKCSRVFQHIFESYQGAGRSIYEEAA